MVMVYALIHSSIQGNSDIVLLILLNLIILYQYNIILKICEKY